MRRSTTAAAALLLAALASTAGANAQRTQVSSLWGASGGSWTRTSRLADFSYSGFAANERAIPNYPVGVDVRQFGAKGDGVTDDSDAIIAAVANASALAKAYTQEECGKRMCLAMGDGFQNAGRQGVAVYMPPGTYVITKMIEIAQSNVVLRGAGVNQTTLYFPKGLKAVYGNQMDWAYMGGYLVVRGKAAKSSDTKSLLATLTQSAFKGQRRLYVSTTAGIQKGQWVRLFARAPSATARRALLAEQPAAAAAGPVGDQQAAAGKAAAAAARIGGGSTGNGAPPRGFLPLPQAFIEGRQQVQELGLDRPEQLNMTIGGGVQAAMADGTLDAYLYGNNAVDSATKPFSGERVRFASRVLSVGPGWIELERPLLYDLRMEWQPAVYKFTNPVQHSGFEGFTVRFKWAPYPAHMKVEGMNGFWFYGSANAWVRNVHIINADTGGEAINCDFITFSNISFSITAPRGGKLTQNADGHHGLWAASSSNVRITGFVFNSRFIHDLTLDVFAQECVYHSGRGIDMSLDMHRSAVHNNLLSHIDVGLGTRPFSSSGDGNRGAHAAANNTWWNIFATKRTDPLCLPSCDFGPNLAFIGGPYAPAEECNLRGEYKGSHNRTWELFPKLCPTRRVNWLVEQLAPGKTLAPADIFQAQLSVLLPQRMALRKQSNYAAG